MKYLLPISLLVASVAAIWPIPVSYSSGNDTLWIDQDVQIILNGIPKVDISSLVLQDSLHEIRYYVNANVTGQTQGYGPNSTDDTTATGQIIAASIERTFKTLFEQNFVPWKFNPRNSEFEPSTESKCFIKSISLTLEGHDALNIFKPLAGSIDESYTLSLSTSGEVSIIAASSLGLTHGLTTFTQLFYAHSIFGVYTPFAPVIISDAPKFPHRGINMDVSRHYFPVADIKRQINAAGYNKMNRFHIHITDGQSWPLEIPALVELSEKGAYRRDLVYTPEDVRELQRYGTLQGVQVYLETDMPGHTSSIAYSHPELIASFNKQPDWDTYAAEPPSGTLKLNSPAVNEFLTTLFDDLLPRLGEYTAYYHTGGDEVNKQAYLYDDTVKSNDSKVLQPLMQKFVDRNHDQIRSYGFTPIVWEEMLLEWNLTLGKDVVVQSWRNASSVLKAVEAGHKVLVGSSDFWYLDCGHGQWLNFAPGPSSEKYYPYADYCTPRKSWRLMYSYDPIACIPPSLQHLVLGGECHIWAEQTDPTNLDRNVWPRAAAAAEVLWSGVKDASGQNRSQVDAAPRLSEMRERLVARGVGAEPVQMPFCLMGKDQCSL